ncbi:unnamed protein product [Paramecium sonneborni]|uniref:Uncharacterized protein n=1 Tax=Paramecium sonneborni TaxID=65129 RepID=A0A8S1LHI6_9CILI|nr:unnamed protein product [Paramecium sonneborni]CAD8066001.1 unnamed protein product [Paramecium sonneborni]
MDITIRQKNIRSYQTVIYDMHEYQNTYLAQLKEIMKEKNISTISTIQNEEEWFILITISLKICPLILITYFCS